MNDWHATIEKEDTKHEHIHQVFDSLDAAIAWATQVANYLGGRPAAFKPETCPVCRERRLSAMRAQNL
jgi:hypothetical protein